jgi:hypothetical protein
VNPGAFAGAQDADHESVIQLTPDYGAIMRAELPSMMSQLGLPQGVTARMAGHDLVYDGPVATLGLPPGVSAT